MIFSYITCCRPFLGLLISGKKTDAGSLDQNNLPPGAKQILGYPDPYQNRPRA